MKNVIFIMAMALVALTGCNHKDLCYLHEHNNRVKVVYDWRYAPGATPAGMCAYFYSMERSGENHRQDFPGAKEGYIDLPEGNYQLISYNNDTEAVQFDSTDKYGSHKAYTRTGDILEPLYGSGVSSNLRDKNDERVVITPDSLWGCVTTDVYVSAQGVKYTIIHSRADGEDEVSDSIITLYPEDLLCHYSYEVRNVKNLSYISQISGALSGMSPSLNLSDGAMDDETVTLPVTAKADLQAKEITGSFLTFGHKEDTTVKHLMSFYVVMKDGQKYVIKGTPALDVTQQVDTAADKRNVHLIIDGLELPTPISSGDGIKATVDDWGVVEEDLEI